MCHSPVSAVLPEPTSDENPSWLVLTRHPVGPTMEAMWLNDMDEREMASPGAGARVNENQFPPLPIHP